MIIIDSDSYKTTEWNGGKTTEMFIYPQNASYAEQNFIFRISSATVEQEKSVFTILKDTQRFLTPLENIFKLKHIANDAKKEVLLYPMQVDCFDGGIVTECFGTGVDFNLMVKGAHGKMICFSGGNLIFSGDYLFVYPYEDITIERSGQTFLPKGTLAMSTEKGKYKTSGKCILICVKLYE